METEFKESPLRLVWKKEIKNVKGVHIFDSGYISAITDKYLYVFDINGDLKWKYEADKITCYSFSKEYITIGLYDNVKVFTITGNLKYEYKIDNLPRVYEIEISDKYLAVASCFDLYLFKDGDVKWKCKFEDKVHKLDGDRILSVCIYENNVIAAYESGYLRLIDMNGDKQWEVYDLAGPEKLKLSNEYIIAMSCQTLYCHDMDGNLKWEFSDMDTLISITSFNTNSNYVVIGGWSDKGDINIVLLDINGVIQWKYTRKGCNQCYTVPDIRNYYITTTCISNDFIICGTADGYVYLFDFDGNLKWKWHTSKIKNKAYLMEKFSHIGLPEDKPYLLEKFEYYYTIYSISTLEDYIIIGSEEGLHTFRCKKSKNK